MRFGPSWPKHPRTRPTPAYLRILARILRRERAQQRGDSGVAEDLDYQPDDPDYWMCPIDEQQRAPLLGPQPDKREDQRAAGMPHQGQSLCRAVSWRHGFLPLTIDQYLELLDWTGRQLVAGKRGATDEAYPPILQRLRLQPSAWLQVIDKFDARFHGAVGRAERVLEHAARTGRRWIQGLRRCRDAFS